MTIQDFKTQHGIQSITFYKGKGRMFAKPYSNITKQPLELFCSSTCDLAKPLFVNEGAHNALWVGNNTNSTVAGII